MDYNLINQHIHSLPMAVLVHDYQRSGSDFIHSLIDEHPQILQTTGTCMFDYSTFFDKWAEYDTREIALMATIDPFMAPLFDSRLRVSERWNHLGEDKDSYFLVDKKRFIEEFCSLMAGHHISFKNVFLSLNAAYMIADGYDVMKSKVIFFHLHHLSNWRLYKNYFLNATLFVTTRDPREGIISYNFHRPKRDYFYMDPRPYVNGIKTFINVFKGQDDFNEQYYISLMALHRSPETLLKNLSKLLGIDYLPEIMTKSTYHGLTWWSDKWSTSANGFKKDFGKNKEWRAYYYYYEILWMEYVFGRQFNKFSYPIIIKRNIMTVLLVPFAIIMPTKLELLFIKYQLANDRSRKLKSVLIGMSSYVIRVAIVLKAFIQLCFKPTKGIQAI